MVLAHTEQQPAIDLTGDRRRNRRERVVKLVFFGAAAASILISGAIVLALVGKAWSFITSIELNQLSASGWFPRRGRFQLSALLAHTLLVTGIAMTGCDSLRSRLCGLPLRVCPRRCASGSQAHPRDPRRDPVGGSRLLRSPVPDPHRGARVVPGRRERQLPRSRDRGWNPDGPPHRLGFRGRDACGTPFVEGGFVRPWGETMAHRPSGRVPGRDLRDHRRGHPGHVEGRRRDHGRRPRRRPQRDNELGSRPGEG